MRSTRNRASSPVEVTDEEEEEQGVQEGAKVEVRLKFKQPLTWKAGRPIAVSDLLRRLEGLSKELQTFEQDEVERSSLMKVAPELASPQLLQHKDRGVKALTACCIVDMFRLCAPDAPYTAQQLREIFVLIVQTIFPALADPTSAYNGQHLYVLKSLAEVKSIILLTDIPGAANIMELLFKECFDVLGGPSKGNEELSKNVEHHMTVVLSTLVDEAQGLPNEVTHTILAQFLRTNPKLATNGVGKGRKAAQAEEFQSTLLLKDAPPAYNMAKNICNASSDKMARNITRYWGAVVADASASLPNGSITSLKKSKRRVSDLVDEDDEMAKMASQDMEEIQKAHDLLRELWRATPAVLQEIIPLLENELSEENLQKRVLAVETVGDMISGIGHAGPPPIVPLDPAAYPSQSLVESAEKQYNFLTTPSSPVSFISRYQHIYQAFLNRRNDKSSHVRAAWATAIGRILLTSAGGVGLSSDDEQDLSKFFADTLQDTDEKVRHNAVKAIERFEFEDIVQKLGNGGGVDDTGSILANLAERVKDKKQHVRDDALRLLGKIWGVAGGAISEGSERISTLLGSIPSKILGTVYINDLEINALVEHILFESLLPISFPPIKNKATGNGHSQRVRDSQTIGNIETDPDKLRAERILVLVRNLDDKAKSVFFAWAKRQVGLTKWMDALLQQCEKYNGGVVDDDEKGVKQRLSSAVDFHAKTLPDTSRASEDLWKFAKAHDRRSYALIRFSIAADSDYKKVKNAFNELHKRLEDASGSTPSFVDTITTLVLRASVLVYNRSHVPAIIEISRSDDMGLGKTAHEVLEKISKDKSEVFKAHVQDLCRSLESEAPTAKKSNDLGAVQDLKACAQFARQFPDDIPKERKFMQALLSFIEHGTPPEAAKYGVLIILMTSDKKQMYAKDIFKQCTSGFEYGSGYFLNRLAALSQLMLLGSDSIHDKEADVVVDIAIKQVLINPKATPAPEEGDLDPEWADRPDENCAAKIWALKILANRLRALPESSRLDEAAKPVFQFLNTLVQKFGHISKSQPSPAAHPSKMRLVAAKLLLRLCRESHLSMRFSASNFNNLAIVAMDTHPQVRSGFANKIMKYMGQGRLSNKFITPLFLLGHDPDQSIRQSAMTWLRARSSQAVKSKDTAMEAGFARLLSLLTHHPDWTPVNDDAMTEAGGELIATLKEFMGYIIYYLQSVGTRDNLSLVYHVAQRVKAHQDGIVSLDQNELLQTMNDRLYVLSDLSQMIIRRYLDVQGWTLQAWPGRVNLPSGIFAKIPDHETAQAVATKNYLPRQFQEDLDTYVKEAMRSKKRKIGASGGEARKRAKMADPERNIKKLSKSTNKTPKKKRPSNHLSSEAIGPPSEPRRSSRATVHKSYIETSDEEALAVGEEETAAEDEEMEDAPLDEVGSEQEEESGAGAEPSETEEEEVETPPPLSSKKKELTKKETPKKQLIKTVTPVKKTAAAKPTRKGKAKVNGTVKATRASKRGKAAATDEYDFPDSE